MLKGREIAIAIICLDTMFLPALLEVVILKYIF